MSAPIDPPTLYLDMNVWVDMARGCSKSEPSWLQVRDQPISARRAGRVVVPLSPAHYLELWHRRDNASRRTVAELMRDITGYVTMASPHVVRQPEAHGLVTTWRDEAAQIPAVKDFLDCGAANALGRADGRLRFVESVASPDGLIAEGPGTEPPAGGNSCENILIATGSNFTV